MYDDKSPPNKEMKLNASNRINSDLLISIFHSMPTGVSIINSKLEVIMANEPAYKMFGFKTEEESLHKLKTAASYHQPYRAQSLPTFLQHIADTRRDGRKVFDWVYCDINGDPVPLVVTLVKLDIIDEYGEALLATYLEDMRPLMLYKENELVFSKKIKAILDATPLCYNIWRRDFKTTMCNKHAYEMHGLKNEEEFLDQFFNLSPLLQPNGRNSTELAKELIQKTFDTGYIKFKWLHINLKGEEIPAEITLVKIDVIDENGDDFLAAFSRDLRDSLEGNGDYDVNQYEIYFLNKISDKTLFHSVSQLSDELFFSFDLRTSIIQYYGKMSELSNLKDKKELFPDASINEGTVCYEDIPLLRKLIDNMRNGICDPIDIRFKWIGNQKHYFRFIYQLIYNAKNEPIFAVGKAVDIQEQRELEVKAQTDLLTYCYNKVTAELEIAKVFFASVDNQQHLLFIVDIDDFKAVNDNLGHYFGDLVLRDIASKLRKHFRNQDIIGRIGGDEFVVLLKDLVDIKDPVKMIEDIVSSFNDTFTGENSDYKVSASIGIAKFPMDGATYTDLYKAADKALYEAKRLGKNCYAFYSEALLDGYTMH